MLLKDNFPSFKLLNVLTTDLSNKGIIWLTCVCVFLCYCIPCDLQWRFCVWNQTFFRLCWGSMHPKLQETESKMFHNNFVFETRKQNNHFWCCCYIVFLFLFSLFLFHGMTILFPKPMTLCNPCCLTVENKNKPLLPWNNSKLLSMSGLLSL